MPSYAKFMKWVLSNKKKLKDFETVTLNEECSAILHKKLALKLKDQGVFIYLAPLVLAILKALYVI